MVDIASEQYQICADVFELDDVDKQVRPSHGCYASLSLSLDVALSLGMVISTKRASSLP